MEESLSQIADRLVRMSPEEKARRAEEAVKVFARKRTDQLLNKLTEEPKKLEKLLALIEG